MIVENIRGAGFTFFLPQNFYSQCAIREIYDPPAFPTSQGVLRECVMVTAGSDAGRRGGVCARVRAMHGV